MRLLSWHVNKRLEEADTIVLCPSIEQWVAENLWGIAKIYQATSTFAVDFSSIK